MKIDWTLRSGYVAGGAALAVVASAVLWTLPELDAGFVEATARRFGPAAIVLLVALGIIVSPIPSGAVAMVAGALYGSVIGGALTTAGAVLGAACAFLLSRRLGRKRLASSQSALARFLTRDRSQTAMTAAVFVTRLIPFVSFDAVSYVAGLTPLRFWRFVAATALGTTPVCMAFAAAGDSAWQGGMHPMVAASMCGVTLVLPLSFLAVRHIRSRRVRQKMLFAC